MLTSTFSKWIGLVISITGVIICLFLSIAFGVADISLQQIFQPFYQFDGSREHFIIRTVRVPRALIALLVGACLAVAGAMMQAFTRNPLSSPELLGVNHGAGLMVVAATFFIQPSSFSAYTWFALVGAGVATFFVLSLSSLGSKGLTSLKIILAGAALTALFASLIQGILILHQQSLDEMRFWLAGSVTGRDLEQLMQVLPFMILGLVCALAISKQIHLLSLGEDVARGLGLNIIWVKLAILILTALLAGSSVAIAGPIGFIGLIVPHMVRMVIGPDYVWVIPYSALVGAIVLLLADVSARFILYPEEVSVGVMTAIVGVPFFIYLARKGGEGR